MSKVWETITGEDEDYRISLFETQEGIDGPTFFLVDREQGTLTWLDLYW